MTFLHASRDWLYLDWHLESTVSLSWALIYFRYDRIYRDLNLWNASVRFQLYSVIDAVSIYNTSSMPLKYSAAKRSVVKI